MSSINAHKASARQGGLMEGSLMRACRITAADQVGGGQRSGVMDARADSVADSCLGEKEDSFGKDTE